MICFTGNQNDAEDLTQDVFIRLLQSQSKFNKQCTLKTSNSFHSQTRCN
ncbi:sigma factor [Peribacillus frigoritolerans]|nr:sigma factor [Peribacillus frigoritolerans]